MIRSLIAVSALFISLQSQAAPVYAFQTTAYNKGTYSGAFSNPDSPLGMQDGVAAVMETNGYVRLRLTEPADTGLPLSVYSVRTNSSPNMVLSGRIRLSQNGTNWYWLFNPHGVYNAFDWDYNHGLTLIPTTGLENTIPTFTYVELGIVIDGTNVGAYVAIDAVAAPAANVSPGPVAADTPEPAAAGTVAMAAVLALLRRTR
jgi:hypothetical protein